MRDVEVRRGGLRLLGRVGWEEVRGREGARGRREGLREVVVERWE